MPCEVVSPAQLRIVTSDHRKIVSLHIPMISGGRRLPSVAPPSKFLLYG